MLFPISVEGRWGYIDIDGRVVIEPRFVKANRFSEGLALVAVAGTSDVDLVFERKYEGFIDPDGRFVIPPESPPEALEVEGFDSYCYGDFHDGLARIHVNDASGMDGFIDRSGKVVVPIKLHTSASFSEGLAFASSWWRLWDDPGPATSGYIDKQGRFVISNASFAFGHEFSGGLAVVALREDGKGRREALIDKSGKYIIPPDTYNTLSPPVYGTLVAARNGEYGLLNSHGSVILPFGKYDWILEPEEGDIFTARRGELTTLLSATGAVMAEVTGDVGRFSDGLAVIEQGGRKGYVDPTGALRIEPQFDQAERFISGLALVNVGKTKGYITPQGDFVWKTDCWDEPVRNKVAPPLSTFLPASTVAALPLSYNWERVKNGIVFAADGSLDDLRAWYRKRCSNELELRDDTDTQFDPNKLAMTIYPPAGHYFEIFAMEGSGDEEEVDGFVNYYSCENMMRLRRKHPQRIIGLLLEN